MEKALFVIDMQNACIGKNHANFFHYDNEKIIFAVNQRIAEYKPENVIYICKVMKDNLINKLSPVKVYYGSFEAQLAEELLIVSNHIIYKYKGDAFSNPVLNQMLVQKKIEEIEIVGVDGGGCVAMTALGAVNNHYRVLMNESAIGTMLDKRAQKYKKRLLKSGAVYTKI